MDKLQTIKKLFEDQKNNLLAISRAEFRSACNDIFDKYTELKSFSWTQFTTFFNDGEECRFYVRPYYGKINGLRASYEEESKYWHRNQGESVADWEQACADDIDNLIHVLSSEFMKDLFGDHIEVIIHRGQPDPVLEDFTNHD